METNNIEIKTKYKEVLDNSKKAKKYSKYYSEKSFWTKIANITKKGGSKIVYAAILLYELLIDEHMPFKTKATIVAALGYLILPFDFIPDIAPIIGLSDDLGILIYALNRIRTSITPTIRNRAMEKLLKIFPDLTPKDLIEIDNFIPKP